MNKNIKKLLETNDFSNIYALQELVDNYTMNYNSTQHSTTEKSPADMILSFPMKTNLNMLQEGPDDL